MSRSPSRCPEPSRKTRGPTCARGVRPGRARRRGLLAAALCSALLAAMAAVPVVAGAAEPAQAPPLPASPAFFTASVSRIRAINGDAFSFVRNDDRLLRIRLADADCHGLGESALGQAKALATDLLQAAPVWIFPVGQTKSGTTDEMWACVWTEKGWLSEVLIRGACAARRTETEGATLGPPDVTGCPGKGPPPVGPAFAAAGATAVDGDVIEVDHQGKKRRVRLCDAACADLDAGRQDAARDAAKRLLEGQTVWVFPCGLRRPGPQEDLPARIWTREGWLAEALVKQGLAKRIEDPDKAVATATGPTTPVPDPAATPAKPPTPRPPAADPKITWREVAVSKGAIKADPLFDTTTGPDIFGCRSRIFEVTSPVMRITWDLKPPRPNAALSLSVFRYDDKWGDLQQSQTHVASFTGLTGSRVLQVQPGKFYIRVGGTANFNMKIEQAEVQK